MPEHEDDSGPGYGGERGGKSQGAEGGQADAGRESQAVEEVSGEPDAQPGNEGGRGSTESERQR